MSVLGKMMVNLSDVSDSKCEAISENNSALWMAVKLAMKRFFFM
jgi:hypothetical protein